MDGVGNFWGLPPIALPSLSDRNLGPLSKVHCSTAISNSHIPFQQLRVAAWLWHLPGEGPRLSHPPAGLVSLGSGCPLARVGKSHRGHLDRTVFPPSPWRPILWAAEVGVPGG